VIFDPNPCPSGLAARQPFRSAEALSYACQPESKFRGFTSERSRCLRLIPSERSRNMPMQLGYGHGSEGAQRTETDCYHEERISTESPRHPARHVGTTVGTIVTLKRGTGRAHLREAARTQGRFRSVLTLA
jgi:hypothetical protein